MLFYSRFFNYTDYFYACVRINRFMHFNALAGHTYYDGRNVPNAGVAAFALMAAGGDFGASVAPQAMGIIVDKVSETSWAANVGDALSMTAEQVGMRTGMITAAVFPVLGVVLLLCMRKFFKRINKI